MLTTPSDGPMTDSRPDAMLMHCSEDPPRMNGMPPLLTTSDTVLTSLRCWEEGRWNDEQISWGVSGDQVRCILSLSDSFKYNSEAQGDEDEPGMSLLER